MGSIADQERPDSRKIHLFLSLAAVLVSVAVPIVIYGLKAAVIIFGILWFFAMMSLLVYFVYILPDSLQVENLRRLKAIMAKKQQSKN